MRAPRDNDPTQSEDGTMEYQRGRMGGPSLPGPDTVTGEMMLDRLLSAKNVAVSSVVFKPGARTYWHSHDEGQLFVISNGRGMVATRDGQKQVVEAGDLVYAPPGEEHWHGAAPDSFLVYTVVSLGRTEWAEEVAEQAYAESWN
jgi:quercetin dioxygenase-like cupin family protein